MEKRSYAWFERRRKSRALGLAREQMTRALDTIVLLQKAIVALSKWRAEKAKEHVKNCFWRRKK